MTYRQAEFVSSEELRKEIQRLNDAGDLPELVGFDCQETPFMAVGDADMNCFVIMLVCEDGRAFELEQRQPAYPVRVLTRTPAAAHGYTHTSDPRGAAGQ